MQRPTRALGGIVASAAVAAVVAWPAGSAQSVLIGPPLPRFAPQLRRDSTPAEIVRRNASCEHCHAAIAAEWRASGHASAFTGAAFQRALDREPPPLAPFCNKCHAPEADPRAPPDAGLAAIGVGCVTCHVPLGPVLAAPVPPGGAPAAAPHAVLRTADFTSSAACAGCHEFAFPGEGGGLMQRTITEHRDAGGAECTGCHMPQRGRGDSRHRSHAFPGARDEAFVSRALDVVASRPGPTTVRLELDPNTTHAVPTGDHFRRLAIRCEAVDGEGSVIARAERFLSRRFERLRASGYVEVGDDRVYRTKKTVELDLPPIVADATIRYTIALERVEHPAGSDESDAKIEGVVTIASGELPP